MVLKALVLLLLQLTVCLCRERELTEDLYQSMGNSSQLLIFTKPKSVPEHFLKALLVAIEKSPVTHFQLLCPDSSGSKPTAEASEVCRVLTDHRVAVRVDGVLNGLATPTEGYVTESAFVSAVLERLLGSCITQLTSYTELVQYTTDHKQHLLLLEPDTTSEEYASMLSALLTWPLPLGVAMTANILPLSRRPLYSRRPPPLLLWCIVDSESGQLWLPFHDTGELLEDPLSSSRAPVQLVTDFVERLQFPIIVHYDNDSHLERLFSDSGLHLVVIFPGLSGASDIEPLPLVMEVAPKSFMNYAFVLADRSLDSEYCARLFVTDNEPMPRVVILPYGQETNLISIDLDGPNFANEVERIAGLLYSISMDNPKTPGDAQVFADLGPSITDAALIRTAVTEKKHHILAYFCHQDAGDCTNNGYSIIRDILSVVRRMDLGRNLAAHVIQLRSEKDAKQFKVESLPGCAVFNKTTGRWSVAAKEVISSSTDVLRFLSQLTGISELEEMGVALFENPPPMSVGPPPLPPPMQEEDQLNLVARSLKHPTLPPQTKLTSDNFEQHISNFIKTVVVFCVKWSVRCKVFSHHIAAAHRLLDKALNVSLATVGCDDYTELCIQYHITDYPTVLLFTPTTHLSPTQLTGVLDARHLLTALGQPGDKKKDTTLVELTPSSFPHLLREGGLGKTIVLLCASDTTSTVAKVFLEEMSRNIQSDLTFVWINSTKHAQLLSHILPSTASSPSLIAINLKQHTTYHLPFNDGLSDDNSKVMKNDLSSFLASLREGTLQPTGHLTEKTWPPMQPPIQFPSPPDTDFADQFHEDKEDHFHDEGFHYHDQDGLHHDHHDLTEGQATNMPHPSTPPNMGHHRHSEL